MDLLHTEVLNYNYRSNHPRTFSFVPGPASQLSWLTDFLRVRTTFTLQILRMHHFLLQLNID